MRLDLADKLQTGSEAVLKIEALVTGQVFYLLGKSADDLMPLICDAHERALEILRSRSIDFIITNSQGKAKIGGLKAGIHHICGISRMRKDFDVWNIQVELKPGENNLVLDYGNSVSIARK
jgi:hypothetical protein